MAHTPYQRTIDALLKARGHDGGLDTFVLDRRSQPDRQSWRQIASDLREETDGAVDITDVALIGWYGDRAVA